MRTWDAIIVGGGVIGLSLAVALHKRGLKPLLLERGEPGREASSAAGGMLAACDVEVDSPLAALAHASAALYPEFVWELQEESGINVDLREEGTLVLDPSPAQRNHAATPPLPLSALEPGLQVPPERVIYLRERSLDPRLLITALLGSVNRRGLDLASGTEAIEILQDQAMLAVRAARATYRAPVVVNCAGCWAGLLSPQPFPVRPVKGQMLSLVGAPGALRHVLRSPEVYVIPRSDGRFVIGATLEEAGYDQRTDPEIIKRLLNAAVNLVPALGQARIHEAWAGLRPGSPDDLPLLGATLIPGYFVATGHYRDGILLAPITAEIMAAIILREPPKYDLTRFSPQRFAV